MQTHFPFFIGIDLGTGSCKSAILDRNGRLLGSGSGNYPAANSNQKWNEQDPQGMLTGMIQAVRQALEQASVDPRDCAAISLGCAMHSLLALDIRSAPLTGIITWADGRGARQANARRGTALAAELYQQTGCPAHGMYPLYKILWLQQELPEVFQKTARFVTAKEYVLHLLTGEWAVDYSIAAGTGLMNTHSLTWNSPSLELAGVRIEQLSPLAGPLSTFTLGSSELAAQMGLIPGTPIFMGCSDAVNSSLGAGSVLPGQATLMVGTSGALRLISNRPVLHPAGRNWCYAIDAQHWLVGGAINNGGIALSWFRDLLNQAQPGAAGLSFDDLLARAGESPCGANGLLCLPFFAGERSPNWNLNARGVFFGLSLQHEIKDIARAILEGIAFRFRSVDEMLAEAGCKIEAVRASGGFVRSDLWLNIMSSALNREIQIPATGETSSLGAAAWALLGAGELSNLEEMAKLAPVESVCAPVTALAQQYDRLYPLYTRLYTASLEAFDELAALSR
jgi:gluconokinase